MPRTTYSTGIATPQSSTEINADRWQRPYDAPHVESWVWRWWNRVGSRYIKTPRGLTSLDHGCGQGAAANFFNGLGFEAHGCDVSKIAIERGRRMFLDLTSRLHLVDPLLGDLDPSLESFSLVTSVQTLYYLTPNDCQNVLENLRQRSAARGIIYLTWMSGTGHYWDASADSGDGMRHVTYRDDRIEVDERIRFAESRDHLVSMLPMIEPLECGRYLQSFRSQDFGRESIHFALTGRWR